jgi:type II secretory pathway component PulF
MSPLSLERVDGDPAPRPAATADAFTLFNRNLAEMVAVGLPLPRAIHEIASGLRGGRFKRALDRIEAALREGKSMDEAVAEDLTVFPPYYRWMLKAGEASGNLSGMLSAVARNAEGLRLARRAFLEALLYPTLIIGFALLLVALGMAFFIPFYRDLAGAQQVETAGLPEFLRTVELTFRIESVVLGSVLAVALAGGLLIRTSGGEAILRRVPLVSRIRRHLLLARLLGALGVLLRAGTPLPKALPVALGAAGSREMSRAADALAAGAAEGMGLGEVLSRTPGISSEIASFLGVAERSGDAPESVAQVAEILMEQVRSDSEALFILLMPIALVIAGVVVGGLLVSVVYPYISLLESLHK